MSATLASWLFAVNQFLSDMDEYPAEGDQQFEIELYESQTDPEQAAHLIVRKREEPYDW